MSSCDRLMDHDPQDAVEQEAALLASVGGSLKEFNEYESQVLREATSSLAPKLTGIGFPNLASLAPSYTKSNDSRLGKAPPSDVPHIISVLSKVTESLNSLEEDGEMESKRAQILRMKRQMLFTYLATFTNLSREEVGIDIGKESRDEERRKRCLKIKSGTESNSSNAKELKRNKVPTGADFDLNDHVDIISRSKTASFGKQALDARNNSLENAKRKIESQRISFMGLKRKLVEDEGEEWVDPEELYRKRLERLKKRRSRKGEKPVVIKNRKGDDVDVDKESNTIGKVTPKTSTTVYCSICQENIPVAASDNDTTSIDLFLSRHMDDCQKLNSAVGRARRSRRNINKAVIYREVEDEKEICTKINNDKRQNAKVYIDDDDIGEIESGDSESISATNSLSYEANGAVDDYSEEDYEDRVDDWTECGISNMRNMHEMHEADERPGAVTLSGGLHIPAWMNDRLFGYQRTALQWLWELHRQEAGGIVGDEMGLGKTVQVCSYLGAMALSRKLRSILIIAPATMLMHWLNELKIWAPGLRRILIHQSVEKSGDPKRFVTKNLLIKLDKWLAQARADRVNEAIDERDLEENGDDSFCGTGYVLITTFENIRRSSDIWVGHKWSYIVLDEGQKIRNPDAEVTIACKRLRTPHRLLLSGTPIQNDLRELWSLFDFVYPGRLGTLPVFISEFADPIKRGGYSNASPMQVQLAYRCALVLRDLINPFLLRRQKKDIKEVSRMPGKTEHVLFCKLSPRQRIMYEAYLKTDEVKNIIRGSAQCFRPIIMLRKICNHPDLICKPDQDDCETFFQHESCYKSDNDDLTSDDGSIGSIYDIDESTLVERSGKLEVLAKILPLWKKQGHRVLIFSQWKKMLDIIHHFVQSQGWKFGRLDGDTNVSSRQKIVDSFNNDNSHFGLLLTTKTGGVGLNLTGANRIILYDPDWNPQNDIQARERAWRFGQKNAVTVYRLITAGTIEEKIYQRQIFKTAISNQILQDPRQRRLFSQKDLRDLFTLKTDVHSVTKGGDGITETGEITKGRGVLDIDDHADNGQDEGGNKETLAEVLKSKGLAGIFDHDIVDKPYAKKSLSVREMEHEASKVASRAAKVLARSSADTEPFTPTWTGSSNTEPQRFGGISKRSYNPQGSRTQNSYDLEFGGAKTAGVGSGIEGTVSSMSLLTHVKQRRSEIGSGGQMTKEQTILDKEKYAINLMKRIHKYIKRVTDKNSQGPTTTQILEEFSDIHDSDAALFKKVLKQVATVNAGRWQPR